jgi:hypothetical protein
MRRIERETDGAHGAAKNVIEHKRSKEEEA